MMMDKEMASAFRRGPQGVDLEEERTWVRFYTQVRRDMALALEVLTELDRDATLRRRHLALYLACQRCLRRHEHRQVRQRQIGAVVRKLGSAVFVQAPVAVYDGACRCGQLLLACLPGSGSESGPVVALPLSEDAGRQPAGRATSATRARPRKTVALGAVVAAEASATTDAPRST